MESKSCPQRPEKQQAGPEFNRGMCFPVGNGHGVKAIGGLGPPLQRSPDGSPRGRFEYGVRHDRGQRGLRSRPRWREPAAAQGKGHDDETPGCFTVRGTRASRGRAEGTAWRERRTGPVGTDHALAPRLARLIAGLTVRTGVTTVLCGQALRTCRGGLLPPGNSGGIALHRGERNPRGTPSATGLCRGRRQAAAKAGTASRKQNFRSSPMTIAMRWWCARLGSNQQPLASEASTLSIELRAHDGSVGF